MILSGQTTGLDHLHAHFHSDNALYPHSGSSLTVVYPKVVLTVVYPKVVLTVVFIQTVVYILTVVSSPSNCSPQHSTHSYFHVIFIFGGKVNNRCKPATTRREEITAGPTRMTALVKGSVAQGRVPPPPEAHVIEYARGSAVQCIELYGRSFTSYFSELGSIVKKALHLKP